MVAAAEEEPHFYKGCMLLISPRTPTSACYLLTLSLSAIWNGSASVIHIACQVTETLSLALSGSIQKNQSEQRPACHSFLNGVLF